MTKVTRFVRIKLLPAVFLAAVILTSIAVLSQNSSAKNTGDTPLARGPAESLYLQLRSVGLDKSRVYLVRDAYIDRSAIHITLDDGTIAFTEDAGGRITGAFFEGEGEVLLTPPDKAERASMSLFTGAAILEERFATAYFRFDDDTFNKLQSSLRPADHAEEFVMQWNETAHNLASMDALQLFMNFSESLPVAGEKPFAGEKAPANVFWHARMQGRELGTFDLYYDSDEAEPIWAGQAKQVNGVTYYDIWSSFSPAALRGDQRTGEKSPSNDFDISLYKIQAHINMPTELKTDAWLQLDARRDGQRTLLFELSRALQVKQVEADGHPVEFIHNQALEGSELARLGNDQVAVVLPVPLHSGQHVQLHFVYSGDVLSDAGGGLVYVGARGSWYPNRRPAMSNFDLEFHYPAGWTLVATGKRSDSSPNQTAVSQTGEQVSHWVSERRMPVAGFNLGKYERALAHSGNITVATYASKGVEKNFPKAKVEIEAAGPVPPPGGHQQGQAIEIMQLAPPSPAHNAQNVADSAAQAIDFFSRSFGPYPYDSLSLTQRPGAISQGWPGLVFLSSFSFLTEGEKTQLEMGQVARTMTNCVIAHETAHQWWGDLVTWGGYRDQWLIEALADYSSLMLLETRDPAQFRSVLESYRRNLLLKNKAGEPLMIAGPVTLGDRLSSSHFPSGYEVISYERGVWLFHMLRNMLLDAERKKSGSLAGTSRIALAEDPFIRTLHKIRTRYEGRTITTSQLLEAFEEDLPRSMWHENHKSLDWFYEGWVNGTTIPRFELDDIKLEEKTGSGLVVTGKVVRKEAPDDLVTLIPVYAVVGGKNVFIGQVFTDDEETRFHLTAPAGTRKVVLDPNHTLLTREK